MLIRVEKYVCDSMHTEAAKRFHTPRQKGNKLNMKHKRRFGKGMQMNLKRDHRAKKKAVVFLGIIPIFL